MFTLDIPGFGHLALEHLVLSYHGTLAVDGILHMGIGEKIAELSGILRIHVVATNASRTAAGQLARMPVHLVPAEAESQSDTLTNLVRSLGPASVVAVGSNRNDAAMLEASALGIAVIHREGASSQTLLAADIVVTSIFDALNLLRCPRRLVTSLRAR